MIIIGWGRLWLWLHPEKLSICLWCSPSIFIIRWRRVSLGDDDDGYVFGSAIKETQLRRRMNISDIVIDGREQWCRKAFVAKEVMLIIMNRNIKLASLKKRPGSKRSDCWSFWYVLRPYSHLYYLFNLIWYLCKYIKKWKDCLMKETAMLQRLQVDALDWHQPKQRCRSTRAMARSPF